jgi:transposase
MRRPQPLPDHAEAELTRLMREVTTKTDYRRVLCLWLRTALGLPAAEIAVALGWRTSSVYDLQSRYLHEGSEALLGVGRGGRHRALLSIDQEQDLLASFAFTAGQGGVTEASIIRQAYERQVGHKVAKSTIYRLLAQFGWRKLMPRPAHPGASPEAQEAFNKNLAVWARPNPNIRHNAVWRCA